MKYPQPIETLIEHFRRFPGVGPKSAERFVFHLLRNESAAVDELVQGLLQLRDRIDRCHPCGTFSDTSPCRICVDARRDHATVCVIAEPGDLLAIERTNEFKGVYHILGGLLAPIEGIGPEQLRVQELVERVREGAPSSHGRVALIREVIFAFDPTIEGETTANYLAQQLAGINVRLTRIARGLPVGGDLEYADPVTLSDALSGRREILQRHDSRSAIPSS